MGNFAIKNQTSKTTFEYSNDVLIAQGEFEKSEAELKTVRANFFRKNKDGNIGDNIGNITGSMRGGKMHYSASEMSLEDAAAVWAAVGEIDTFISEDEDNDNKEE